MVRENGASQRLSILNGHPSMLEGPQLLHELVRPLDHDATAIDFLEHGSKRRKFSYKTLHLLSDVLAGRITEILAKLESVSPIIPVFLPQSPELYVVILAILKAGKAFCPLNLDTPSKRLEFILDDISADLIVTSSSYYEQLKTATSIQVVCVDGELSDRGHRLTVNLPQPNTNDLAYVLYTSGSTGMPKAVSVSHRAVTQSLLAHDSHIPDFHRFLQFAAPTFDVSIFEIFFPWLRGRTLVGCTREQMLDDLPKTINSLEVDAAELTPTVASNLLHGRASVPGLKLLLTIGEMLTQHVVDEYGGTGTLDSILWAMYGPTEASIHCTLQPNFPATSSTATIGFPLETVSAFVIAPAAELQDPTCIEILPVGQIGELAIGGPQVAEEYLNRPDLTSASFVDHLYYGRLYRTGDRAKINEHGILECLGRVVAGQVKLRGQRVELGEIEKAIMKMESCRTAVVMVLQDNLVAFCAVDCQEVSRADVLVTCKQWLPAFMIPSDVCLVEVMPQLPSGKTDKDALAKSYSRTVSSGDTPVSATSGDPQSLAILDLIRHYASRSVTMDSNLSLSGLDSLRSIRIASALRREGYNVGAMDVLSASTVRDLVAVCKSDKTINGGTTDAAKLSTYTEVARLRRWHNEIAYVIPCTPLQEAMLAETISRPSAYCNWIEVELLVPCKYERIRDAIRVLASATEILRTGFLLESQHSTTFSQVIWKDLLPSQIREVNCFSKAFSLQSDDDLLRPLTIQITTSSERPRLLFQMHHALYDGWSFDLILYDLDKIIRGEETISRQQFQAVTHYLVHKEQCHDHDSSKKYWASLLSDYIPTTIPNYHGKLLHSRAIRRFSGKSAVCPRSLARHARELAINPQVYFQAATACILRLYSGATDVVLGNVTSGRTMPIAGVEDVIGPCMASVPFRMDFSDTHCIRDILSKTQAINRESLRHSTVSLREIARAANVQPGTQLFDILFVWQQSIVSDSNSSLVAQIVDNADESEFRVTLEFEPRGDDILFRATFDVATIPEQQIAYMARQIDQVVELFLANVNGDIACINRCFATESLSIANAKPLQRPIDHGPSHAVEHWAATAPYKSAIVFGHLVNGVIAIQSTATYGMLNSRANQLARVLAEHGVGNDQLVCIIMEKSIDLYVSILAVLKLGCGYLPLVPETPLDRVKTILVDAQVRVCVSESSISSAMSQDVLVDFVDFDLIRLSDYPDENLDVPYNGQHLAYAVFTSGSTGTPKGVLVTQDNLMSNLQYLSTLYPFSENSRLLQSCSQAFDVSVFEVFFSWYVGLCLCSAKKDDVFHDFEAAINRLEITHLSLTPTVAALVDPRNVPKVEFLVTAGEALTETVRRKWAGKGLYQGYGPSETTNICTVRAKVTSDDLINNIGMPFDNTSAFVFDPDSNAILPRGAVGELCFGGSQVFRGYLNRPELNAAKIMNHPLHGRIYRSGDMGILLPDDSILSTGRSDDQVKIRGQRVELGEITSILLDHEAVRDCVTLVTSRYHHAKMLVNFWVPATNATQNFRCLQPTEFGVAKKELFALLSRRLPTYMVPSNLIPISYLPMTPQAKIDRRLLLNLFSGLTEAYLTHTANSEENSEEPGLSSEWEQSVAQVLAQVLDIPPSTIRRSSSFFNLGLDSVSAIQFCSELRKEELGDFAVSMLLKNPSIAHLASVEGSSSLVRTTVKKLRANLDNVFNPKLVSEITSYYEQRGSRVARILPCTPLQEAMLSSGQSSTDAAYCNVMIFDIRGDVSQLQLCWEHMVQRHEILRTSFFATEESSFAFAQVILHREDLAWHHQKLGNELRSQIYQALTSLLEANEPPVYFALAQDGLSTKLLFCCHHALYDGIAISTLVREVQDLYLGYNLPSPISYDTYLHHMLVMDAHEADDYWNHLLDGFEPTYFPTLTSKIANAPGSPACSTRDLALPLDNIRQACRNMSVSLLSVIHAAWAKLLHLYMGENDICFGNVVSGRSIPGEDLERLVAPCFNTLPVRVVLDSAKSNRDLTKLIHTLNIDSLAYQLTPLRHIQKKLIKDGGRLFDTLVILQQPKEQLNDSIWSLDDDIGDMDLPVVCEIIQDQTRNALKLVLHYNTSLLAEADASVVMETFDASLVSIIEHRQASSMDIVEIPSHLRAESDVGSTTVTASELLHSGFERMSSLDPDRVALDFLHPEGGRTTWSFMTLNHKANHIAHTLIEAKAGPEDIIPIHISKSPQFYASILGVLKAGAAFAPVHPDLPEARRKLMLAELKPKLLLCSDCSIPPKGLTEALVINVGDIAPSCRTNPVIGGLKNSHLAYCLFTSGSTGVPKAYAATSFDMCYYDCFLAWTFGFTLCVAEQNHLLNDLPKVINTLGVDLLDLTPSVAASLRRSDVPNVKWLYCIGEAMSPAVVKEWGALCVNSYGPTEAAFCTTMSPVSKGTKTSIIGKPFPSTSFAVFSERGKSPLAMLSVGELYIGGAQLARGYFGKPDLTNERFVSRCGQRFYKSGDRVRMLSDRSFEFLGRTDDQVKIRGLRVELGEINSVLQESHPDIPAITTQILRKDTTAKEQLVCFLALHQDIEETERITLRGNLKKTASTHLPSYMVPSFFLFVKEIPKSMAGKIDKNALTSIFRSCADETSLADGISNSPAYQWNELESRVRQVLARLSKTSLDDILPTTSIYQLGLDSISAVQIAAALRKQGQTVNATDVLRHTSCAELAAHIDRTSTVVTPATPVFNFTSFECTHKSQILKTHDIKHGDVIAIRPCTPLQEGMASQFLAKEGSVYMNHVRLQLELDTDMDRLKMAWATTTARHSMLRTGFVHVEDPLHSFAMVEYTPDSVTLQWIMTQEGGVFDPVNAWLGEVRSRALDKLHLPPWQVRVVCEDGHLFLDLAIFHAIFDARSLQLIFHDVAAAYHEQALLPPLSLDPVIDSIIRSNDEDKSRDQFWAGLGKLANPSRFPNLAPLRYDVRPPLVCTRRSNHSLDDLESGCRAASITLQAAGIASWLSLLSAYTGESSVTCGVVLSGRTFEAAESVVFPCINTVPFALKVAEDRAGMLKQVMALNVEMQQYQSTSLNEARRLMGFPNESLFDTIFAYQKLSVETSASSPWSVVDEKATIEYPLSIELEPNAGRLEYRLTFLPHIIPEEQATLILQQLDHLMEDFILPTKTTVVGKNYSSQLYSITPAKEYELMSDVRLLHEFVEQTATRYPERVAFEFFSAKDNGERFVKRWTYSELDVEANRVSQLLRAHGVKPGSLVGVCFDKCPEASFAMLGILKAGCAFVAIDPGAPAARQAFIVEDSQAQAILSLSSQSHKFKTSLAVPILDLDHIDWHSLSGSKLMINREISPQDRSYCLYTSGTTGTPKGCELTHENAVQALLAFQRLFAGHWDETSRWLQFASFHFDVSVLEQYWSWSVGICVVSAPRDLIFEDLSSSIRDLNVTHIDLTPSLAQILHPDNVPSLCKGVFITGGESLKQEILDVWGPKSVIYNGYGPTEATIGCTMYPRVPANGKPSNIGPQFDNVGSLVLHPGSDVPVFRGGVGELCVSGKLVGKGYLNRPELTAERFPHLERFGERVYRTGDLVRILHDGTFDFLGRADDQVKLRGQRLEVGEINSIIRQSGKGISDVATLVLKHPKQQKEQLVAFLVCASPSKPLPEVILRIFDQVMHAKEACQEELPPYMVPTHFIPLTAMPLNVNNKADGKALRGLYEDLSPNDLQKLSATVHDQQEPWSDQEKKVHKILSQTLGMNEESITKDTSLFELGMDSITVIGVSRALKQSGLSEATASLVMRYPTIRRLTKALGTVTSLENSRGSVIAAQQSVSAVQHRYRRVAAHSLSVEPGMIEALAPCTPLQQGMIARSSESDEGLYFNTFQLKLKEDIDEEKLNEAWQKVYASTQILRTVFINTEEGYVQAVLQDVRFSGVIHTAVEHQRVREHLDNLRREWLVANQAELRRLFEVHLVVTEEEKLLVIHIFHALYDGNSIGLIFQAVWNAYHQRASQSVAPSFHAALAYGPLRMVDGAKRFWQGHISMDSLSFPSAAGKSSMETIVTTRQLRGLVAFDPTRRQLSVTAQAIIQACWLSVLQQHVQGILTTGMVVSGRSINLEGAERIMGPMFNTIPYQHRAQTRESWASIIKRIHDYNVASHPYQHTALRDIMKWCKRAPSRPLFDNLFVYQVSQDDEDWTSNDTWTLLDGDTVADYPVAFEVEQKSDSDFNLTLVTQGHVAYEGGANELLDRFEDALHQVLEDPSALLELPIGPNVVTASSNVANTPADFGTNVATDFAWTDSAIKIREEIANLSGNNLEEINEATSIFELGLDSIDAIKLSSRVKKRGINLPVSAIMRGLNIGKMVMNVSITEDHAEDSTSESDFDLQRQRLIRHLEERAFNTTDIEAVLPLTPLQEAMVAEMTTSGYTRYYNSDVLELSANTNTEKLQQAWVNVVEHSPILRTGFVQVDDPDVDGSFAQIIHQQPHKFWSQINLEEGPDFPSIFEKLRTDARQTPLLTPPFRLVFIETPNRNYLVLSIAHALYDGWALSLLHSDVHRAYGDELTSRPSYVSSLAGIISASGSDAVGFWRDYLSDATKVLFPRRAGLSSDISSTVHRYEHYSAVALDGVQAFAKRSNISLQTVGQTVFALVSAFYTHSLDVTFGSVLSGRDDDEMSQLLFPTMNTVAIRAILHGNGTEMLRYVQDNLANIKQWQHYPLRKALSQAGVGGRLFEGLFIYQKSLEQGQNRSQELYTSVGGHSDVEYPVCVEMEVIGDALVWRCAVKEEVFNEEGAKVLLDRMDDVLKYLMANPEAPVIGITTAGTSVCGLPMFGEDGTGQAKISELPQDKRVEISADTPTTRKIRKILAAVSKIPEDEITSDMTIFHMGLDSISAIKVSSLLRKQNVIITVGEMLRAGTVAKMARVVAERAAQASHHNDQDDLSAILESLQGLDIADLLDRACINNKNAANVLPVTAGQLYMLSMWVNTDGSNFHPEFTYEMHGDASFEALQSAWEALVRQSTILRTCFVSTTDDQAPYVQIVLKEVESPITDVTNCEEYELCSLVQQISSAQPWAHVFVSKVPSGWKLTLKIHHALYDGVSLPLLMQQLQNLCNGGAAPPCNDAFDRLIAHSSTASAQQERKAFWEAYLNGVAQKPLPQPPSPPTARTEVFMPALLRTNNLEKTTRQHGISTQALFLAAYAKIYSRLTAANSSTDVVIGVYLANRSLPIANLSTAAVPTVNLLPLRVISPQAHSLIETATQIQADLLSISSPANASSLFEIGDWTGVKIDTFVNFLSLPDVQQQEQGEDTQQHITIKPTQQWEESVNRIVSASPALLDKGAAAQLVNKRVNDVYLHALDIEATVRNNGRLDIGVFAPVEMLSLDQGEQLVKELAKELEEL
ncbi:EntF, Non-ribosomal peptide synthetase module protein [Pyrenophora tritici-repentis]|uniref:EntF, Non-ribosomal peptide synthetase module protein n=1 Tax=Pyrenophora tritici-repentis TaxID=45151 RepID=A0A834RRN0_9PLEO|nr:EntF, Non-ribosomal peptide synthetase module protein [Pyrenophora tritici-repentis]